MTVYEPFLLIAPVVVIAGGIMVAVRLFLQVRTARSLTGPKLKVRFGLGYAQERARYLESLKQEAEKRERWLRRDDTDWAVTRPLSF